MALQPSITEYFATRKRAAIDDAKRSSQPSKKVMILENADGDVSIRKLVDERRNAPKIPSARRKLIYPSRPSDVVSASEASVSVTKKKVLRRVLFDKKVSSSPQPDIRKTFGVLNGKPSSSSSTLKAKETTENCTNEGVNGNNEMKIAPREESLKPLEKLEVEKSIIVTTEVKETTVEQTAEKNSKAGQSSLETLVEENFDGKSVVSETETSVSKSGTSVRKSSDNGKSSVLKTGPVVEESATHNAISQKDTNLDKLKSRIQKNSKLNELKASLAKLNNGFANLEKIQKEKKNFGAKVQLDKFDMITFESTIPSPSKKTPIKMCMSPAKLREAAFGSPTSRRRLDLDSSAAPAPFVSPRKLLDSAGPLPPSTTPPPSSPLKSPLKSPAFQRYQALVSEGKSALTLPFKYRSLAEVFRAIETVVSMLEKRQETTTFTKLKTSVQELLRRNLFEKHLAQIRAVNDGFYTFQYEKVHAVGSNKLQGDRYELIVKPVLGALGQNMSPDVLLERRRQFYACLLDRTKVYHEQFLGQLDPPLCVPRAALTRWHPEFDVDSVPDIEAAALPQPPCSTKASTAKDVLEKARNLFTSNPRMERALQKVSEQQSSLAEPAATTATTNTGPAVAALTTALRGIPKSLLEKVRAKQAARALEAMTRSPSQAKEAIRLTRLPEIARIVRNTFISEKKCVLTRELVLKKLSNSYRERLSFQELDSHLNLLQEKTPEWLNFCTFRKTDYVKFVKDADMLKVMAKLEALASENSY